MSEAAAATGIAQSFWGYVGGKEVWLFELANRRGTKLYVSNFGATAQALLFNNSAGCPGDVLLGYDGLQDYITDEYYMGGVVGRYANRIAGGKATIEGKEYQLAVREGGYHLHGGVQGFNKKVFDFSIDRNNTPATITFKYTSPHLEEGFPGTLCLEVAYTLDESDQWTVAYKAWSDATTIVNLTQHAYFNLAGNAASNILTHELTTPVARYYLPVNDLQVPTGAIAAVAGTAFDFREAKTIGKDIFCNDAQLHLSNGYDHSFVLEPAHTPGLKHAAIVREPCTGRRLDVFTTEPAVHFYSGNFLQNVKGKNGSVYHKHAGFCLETQHFPDAPNHLYFPSTLLRANEVFSSKTVFALSVV